MDEFYIAKYTPFVNQLRGGDRVIIRRKGKLEINYIVTNESHKENENRGVLIDGEYVPIRDFHRHGVSVVWNGPMPDNDDMAKRYVRWREENGNKPFIGWIVVKAPDHFIVTPLIDVTQPYSIGDDENEGQLILGLNGLTAMRGMITAEFTNEADTFCPGDLVMGKLLRAEVSKKGFTYKIDQVVGLGTFDDVRSACNSIKGSHYHPEPDAIRSFANYHASVRMLENEEGRAVARTEPNEALVLVDKGSAMVLDRRGITLHEIDDPEIYLEATMPENDGVYYVSDITSLFSNDWESGHVDMDIEGTWEPATPEHVEKFFTREGLENELREGYEIEDTAALMQAIYGEEA